MYDFSKQKRMYLIALELLKENNINDISALGGGTVLATYYWNHRYSTDIDIFIYGDKPYKNLLRPTKWSENIKNKMLDIGYKGDYKLQNIYLEFALNDDEKIQFFDVLPFTNTPFFNVKLWGKSIFIESIEEIIAKKIYYRADKGNARDLFDIAIAINKQADIFLNIGRVGDNSLKSLFDTVRSIKDDKNLKDKYLFEIEQMSPNPKYSFLAKNTIEYLYDFLENYLGAKDMNICLNKEDLKDIEDYIYDELNK